MSMSVNPCVPSSLDKLVQPVSFTRCWPGHFELSTVTDGFESRENYLKGFVEFEVHQHTGRILGSFPSVYLDEVWNEKAEDEKTAKKVQQKRAEPLSYIESVEFSSNDQNSIVRIILLTRRTNNELTVLFGTYRSENDYSLTNSQKKQFEDTKKYLTQLGVCSDYSFHISGNDRVEKLFKSLVALGYLEPYVLDMLKSNSFRNFLKTLSSQTLKVIKETNAETWFASKEQTRIFEGHSAIDCELKKMGIVKTIDPRCEKIFARAAQVLTAASSAHEKQSQ